jgi:hypothetical protein
MAQGGVEGTQALCVKAASVAKWAQRNQKSIQESWEEVRNGTGKRVIKSEMCTQNDEERGG